MEGVVYIKLFVDYLDAIEPLSDAERGRLFTALLEYARTGEATRLNGNERFLFPMMRAQMDRDITAMKAKDDTLHDVRSEAGRKGGLAKSANAKQTAANVSKSGKSKQTVANVAKDNRQRQQTIDDLTDDQQDNRSATPLPPASVVVAAAASESPPFADNPVLQGAFEAWIRYKHERREDYKPTGAQSLISRIQKSVEQYGAQAVAEVIRDSMAQNYKGIIFDWLAQRQQREDQRGSDKRGQSNGRAGNTSASYAGEVPEKDNKWGIQSTPLD